MLQAVLAGFGGLRITDEGVEQQKTGIPASWKTLRIVGVGKEDVLRIAALGPADLVYPLKMGLVD